MLVKSNNGEIYWPSYGIDKIDPVCGAGLFYLYDRGCNVDLYRVPETDGDMAASLLRLPEAPHYARHANTGQQCVGACHAGSVRQQGRLRTAAEIGAFDANGTLVGSGTVIRGLAAVTLWGRNTQTKSKDGLNTSEKVTFKLWNKTGEYPVEFTSNDGNGVRYAAQGVFVGVLAVPEAALIKEFSLARAYPNPFRGFVRVAFDVPTINGIRRTMLRSISST